MLSDLALVLEHGGGHRGFSEWEEGFIRRVSRYHGPLSTKQQIVIWGMWVDVCYEP